MQLYWCQEPQTRVRCVRVPGNLSTLWFVRQEGGTLPDFRSVGHLPLQKLGLRWFNVCLF